MLSCGFWVSCYVTKDFTCSILGLLHVIILLVCGKRFFILVHSHLQELKPPFHGLEHRTIENTGYRDVFFTDLSKLTSWQQRAAGYIHCCLPDYMDRFLSFHRDHEVIPSWNQIVSFRHPQRCIEGETQCSLATGGGCLHTFCFWGILGCVIKTCHYLVVKWTWYDHRVK